MIQLTFPDGAVRDFAEGVTGRTIAEGLSRSLAKKAAVVRIDGVMLDLDRPLERGGKLEILTRDDPALLDTIRHDASHVMAEAVQELFPGTQVTIGPSIEDGFYYDFARDEPFSLDDLPRIEARMREIVDRDEKITREVLSREAATARFEAMGEAYKAEIIADLPADQTITVYHQGAWQDLCRGPHLPSTRFVGKAFKLTKLAGAYWRGDHRNAQLQRIYGTAWASAAKTSKPTCTGSRRRSGGTTGSSAAPWTCSTSRRKGAGWCSGTPRAGRSIARSRPTCAEGSTPRATAR